MKKYTTQDLRNPEMKLAIEYKGDLDRLNKVFSEALGKSTFIQGTSKYYTINGMFGGTPPGYTTVTESEILLMSEAESEPTKIKKGTVMQCIYDENYKVVFVGYRKNYIGYFKGVTISNDNLGYYSNEFVLKAFKPVQS